MNNRIIVGRILLLIVALILTFACLGYFLSGGTKPAHALENPVQVYSNCVNPGQFWANSDIDQQKYLAIFLHYCTRVGDGEVSQAKAERKTAKIPATSTQTSPPVPTKIIPTPKPTENPTQPPVVNPTKTPKPENTCKNKNSGKDGTPAECNAGKGQEKHG